MGKRNNDYDLETMMDGWLGVTKDDDPMAWAAWRDWRRDQLKCFIEPRAFTVPSQFPPVTVAAAKEYIAVLKQVRKSIGWNDEKARLPADVYAWMGSGAAKSATH